MTNLITSHSHSNSKKIGKEEFTNIHKASCLVCHISLLNIVSSWHPWHVTFTFLVGAWSQSICVYKLSIELCKQGQSFREGRKGALSLCHIEICHSAYGAFSISYLAPQNVRHGYLGASLLNKFDQYKLHYSNRFRLHEFYKQGCCFRMKGTKYQYVYYDQILGNKNFQQNLLPQI